MFRGSSKVGEAKTMSNNDQNYLALSLIIAALIVGGSMIWASNNLVAGADRLQVAAPSTGLAILPPQAPEPSGNQPEAAPPAAAPTGPEMKGLLKDPAGKMGQDNAPVVFVEYSDFQCPFCGRWYKDSAAQLKRDYVDTGKVLFLYKDFPLSFHPNAGPAANAARCAAEQGKFWEFHDKVFENQEALSADNYKKWAKELKLNAGQFDSCFAGSKYNNLVQANFSEGSRYGVSGTPSFLVGKAGGKAQLGPQGSYPSIVGAMPYSEFKDAIDALLK